MNTSEPRHLWQRGSTLIEQIMVLAIVLSLAGMATPPLRKLLTRSQMQSAQTDFIAGLQHARATAITSGRQTLFCPTLDGTTCSDARRWENGWLLASDSNLDNQPDNGPLYRGPGYTGKLMIQSSAGRHFVRFHADGTASGSNMTLLFCSPSSSDNALSVVISNSGRVRGAPASTAQAASCAQMR
jgi:type IV fimbrial biogenesis protein FimT